MSCQKENSNKMAAELKSIVQAKDMMDSRNMIKEMVMEE